MKTFLLFFTAVTIVVSNASALPFHKEVVVQETDFEEEINPRSEMNCSLRNFGFTKILSIFPQRWEGVFNTTYVAYARLGGGGEECEQFDNILFPGRGVLWHAKGKQILTEIYEMEQEGLCNKRLEETISLYLQEFRVLTFKGHSVVSTEKVDAQLCTNTEAFISDGPIVMPSP